MVLGDKRTARIVGFYAGEWSSPFIINKFQFRARVSVSNSGVTYGVSIACPRQAHAASPPLGPPNPHTCWFHRLSRIVNVRSRTNILGQCTRPFIVTGPSCVAFVSWALT